MEISPYWPTTVVRPTLPTDSVRVQSCRLGGNSDHELQCCLSATQVDRPWPTLCCRSAPRSEQQQCSGSSRSPPQSELTVSALLLSSKRQTRFAICYRL